MKESPKYEREPREKTRLEILEEKAQEKFYDYLLAKGDTLRERIIEIEHGPEESYSQPGAPELKYPSKKELAELKQHGEEVANYLFNKLQKAEPSSRFETASILLGWLDLTETKPSNFSKDDVRRLQEEQSGK